MTFPRHHPLWLRYGAMIAGLVRPFRFAPPAILVIRLGSLGDGLLFTGGLRALRRRYPGHKLVLVTSSRALPVFERSPEPDALWSFEEESAGDSSFVRRWRRLRLAVGVLSRRYDLAVSGSASMDDDAASGPVPGYPALYDFAVARQKCAVDPRTGDPVHELDRLVPLFRSAGCEAVKSRADIWPDPHLADTDRQWAQTRLVESLPASDLPPPLSAPPSPNLQPSTCNLQPSTCNLQPSFTLSLCPGARFKQKSWGAANYAALLHRMAQEERFRDMRIVMLGGPEDREIAVEIIRCLIPVEQTDGSAETRICFGVRQPCCRFSPAKCTSPQQGGDRVTAIQSGGPSSLFPSYAEARMASALQKAASLTILNLTGAATVHQSMAVIERSDLCIGNDTFGLHAAIAVGTPSLVLMWGGDGDRWIPWGDPTRHRMVRADVDCGGCEGHCIHPTIECMQSISPERVVQLCRDAPLMERPGFPGRTSSDPALTNALTGCGKEAR